MSAPRTLVERFALGPVAAVRPWLFAKAFLLLLAVDVWHTFVGPAWRYGAAGFNVAHFAILDGLPLPTREAYVGMLVLVGVLAFVSALAPRLPRPLVAVAMVLFTWGWSCSMLDSYQHHYLLSMMMLGIALFPALSSRDLFGTAGAAPARTPITVDAPAPAPGKTKKKKAKAEAASESAPARQPEPREAEGGARALPHGLVARVPALGWTLVTSLAGVVYGFTMISKLEPEWRSGDALRSITHEGTTVPSLMELAGSLGIDARTVFSLMGWGAIAIQVVCAAGYLTASLRDGEGTLEERRALEAGLAALAPHRERITIALAVATMLGVAAGFAFHAHVGLLVWLVGLGVGLPRGLHRFLFAPMGGRPRPLSVLASLAMVGALSFHLGAESIGLQIGWFSYYMIALAVIALAPAHWLALAAWAITTPARGEGASWTERAPLAGPLAGMAAVVIAALAGDDLDLPGAFSAAVVCGVLGLAAGMGALARPALRDPLTRGALGVGVAMLVCWGVVTQGEGRYDFYRFGGGDYRRRHEYRAALEDYRAANRHAPPGQSREERVREMEQAIEREGAP
jgi:hypothetical protein